MTETNTKRLKKNQRKLLKLFIGLLFIVIVILCAFVCSNEDNDDALKMNIRVFENVDAGFYVKSTDRFSWYNVNFYLNYGDNISSGYYLHYDHIVPVGGYLFRYFEFKNDDGKEYDINTEALVKMKVEAETKSGERGTYFISWQ